MALPCSQRMTFIGVALQFEGCEGLKHISLDMINDSISGFARFRSIDHRKCFPQHLLEASSLWLLISFLLTFASLQTVLYDIIDRMMNRLSLGLFRRCIWIFLVEFLEWLVWWIAEDSSESAWMDCNAFNCIFGFAIHNAIHKTHRVEAFICLFDAHSKVFADLLSRGAWKGNMRQAARPLRRFLLSSLLFCMPHTWDTIQQLPFVVELINF